MSQEQSITQSMQTAASAAEKYGIELGTELTAELTNPTTYTYEQQVKDATPSSFYEQEMWMNIQPRRNEAKPVDMRSQQEVVSENYLVEKHKAEQPQEQAEQVQGQNARLIAAHLEYGWENPSFQQYLDSDDDAYEQVQLSPQQLQLASEMWGLDEDTARAYVYHHKLTAEDLALIETSFTGKASLPAAISSASSQKQIPNTDDDDTGYAPDSTVGGNPDSAGDYDSVAALDDVNHIRRTYFSQANDAEWSQILNDAISEFESLSPLEREPYDNPAGIWALHQRVSYRKQQQVQTQRASSKQQQRQKKKPEMYNTSKFTNTALTTRGMLKQSWVDSLTPQQYEKQADRIYHWYAKGMVDRNA
ncbi:MAG: hypothetical protein N4J56_001770 [Chroococcidiopsis sp. SAG 2025]|uniref:hypothetical protein n=1 Tax=Chroococcidiopsis sp. SAG 2025 TaxID=171389 RepID=UPI002936F31A|nr:hypothetical protein [Chroococcidiopsis sp. SAG 2025]MDV2992116.1 hypothetical protein [Chroococcidiopsis sp. SAG 2025]